MIKVAIFKDGFLSVGHADYAEYGKDIVCSAVSALTQTAMLSLEKQCEEVMSAVASGRLRVLVKKPNNTSQIIINTLMIGLLEIEKQYPNNLKVEVNFNA